jgi:membrane protein required for colicin V production
MNIFDAIVVGLMLVAIVMGYQAGLLRSLATIFGYLLAAPVAIAATPKLAPLFSVQAESFGGPTGLLFFAVFLGVGLLLGATLRGAISFAVGEEIGMLDRTAGGMLGAVRIVLLATLMVLVFDRLVPPKRQPAWLAQSQLRPYLSLAGAQGVRTLPPDLAAHIDRLKKERGI